MFICLKIGMVQMVKLNLFTNKLNMMIKYKWIMRPVKSVITLKKQESQESQQESQQVDKTERT